LPAVIALGTPTAATDVAAGARIVSFANPRYGMHRPHTMDVSWLGVLRRNYLHAR